MVGRREPEHVRISKSLGVAIATGRHPPESILPGEIELAQQYAVSRSVVREALRILAGKGLLTSKPRAGTRVRERMDWNLLDPELLAWMFEGEPPAHYVRSLFQLRMIVEPAAAELAAVGRSARHLSRMGHMLELMAKHGLADAEGQRADEQFHSIILDATGNELLLSLAGSIAAAVRWTTFFKFRATRHLRDSVPLHRTLFEAIAEGDPAGAREATVNLIRDARDDTEAALRRIK